MLPLCIWVPSQISCLVKLLTWYICFPDYQDRLFLCLEDAALEDLSVFLSSFAFQCCLPEDPTNLSLNKLKTAYLKSRVCSPLCSFFITLRIWNTTIQLSLQPRLPLCITSLVSSSLLLNSRSTSVPALVGPPSTHIKKLSLTSFRSLIGCLCSSGKDLQG